MSSTRAATESSGPASRRPASRRARLAELRRPGDRSPLSLPLQQGLSSASLLRTLFFTCSPRLLPLLFLCFFFHCSHSVLPSLPASTKSSCISFLVCVFYRRSPHPSISPSELKALSSSADDPLSSELPSQSNTSPAVQSDHVDVICAFDIRRLCVPAVLLGFRGRCVSSEKKKTTYNWEEECEEREAEQVLHYWALSFVVYDQFLRFLDIVRQKLRWRGVFCCFVSFGYSCYQLADCEGN